MAGSDVHYWLRLSEEPAVDAATIRWHYAWLTLAYVPSKSSGCGFPISTGKTGFCLYQPPRQTGGGNCLFRLILRRHCGPMFRCGLRLIATACLLAIVSELDSQFPPVRCEARCEPLIAVVLFPPVGLEPIVFAAPSRRGCTPEALT